MDIAHSNGLSGSSVSVATVIFVVLASIFFGLRVWARLLISGWGTDDWLMLAGWVLFLAQPALTVLSHVGHHHRDDHYYPGDITQAQYENGKRIYFFVGILYTINITIIKASICILMLRVARLKVHRLIFKGVIYISVLSSAIRIISWFARCKIIRDNWEEKAEYHPESCAPKKILTQVSIFFSTICIGTDIICAVLPAVIVWKLQMEWKTRLSVVIMLGLGVGASIATMIRVKYLFTYEQQHDVLAQMAPIALYSNLETALGIIAACIAAMRPLLRFLPCVSGIAASRRSNRGPYQAHRMQRLDLNREPRPGQPGGVEGMDSQTLVLQYTDPANPIDEEDRDNLVRRHDTAGEGETARHALD